MTMQIALKGTDGLVLASDTKFLEIPPSRPLQTDIQAVNQPYDGEKVVFCPRTKIAVAFSGNGILGEDEGASALISHLADMGEDSIAANNQHLVKWANDFFRSIMQDTRTQLAAAHLTIVDPLNSSHNLWKLAISNNSQIHHYSNVVTAGDVRNPATFWARYFHADSDASSKMTVEQLRLIAALVIYSAHEINSYGVYGLQIWTWKNDTWTKATSQEINRLKQQYEEFTDPIWRRLSLPH